MHDRERILPATTLSSERPSSEVSSASDISVYALLTNPSTRLRTCSTESARERERERESTLHIEQIYLTSQAGQDRCYM